MKKTPLLTKEGCPPLRRVGGSLLPAEFEADPIEDPFYVLEYKLVLKSDHIDADVFQEKATFIIANASSISEMSIAIKLDCELYTGAVEIQYVTRDTVLTSKLVTIKARVL